MVFTGFFASEPVAAALLRALGLLSVVVAPVGAVVDDGVALEATKTMQSQH